MEALIFPLLLFGLLWFFLIRPQRQRMRERAALVAALEPGDRIVTVGGIHGTVTMVDGEEVRVSVAPTVELTLARRAVGEIVPDPVIDGSTDAGPPGPIDGGDDPADPR